MVSFMGYAEKAGKRYAVFAYDGEIVAVERGEHEEL